MRKLRLSLLLIVLFPFYPRAQSAPPAANPLSDHHKGLYNGVKKILVRSAELMPEENYGFKPAPTVRTYGEILAHVADAQYAMCSAVLGQKHPGIELEKNATKAELIAALNSAFAYCDKAYDGMTDATATDPVRHMGGDRPKHGVLTVNLVHTIEHYGNLITYMRMKDVVPPTSDPAFMKQLMK